MVEWHNLIPKPKSSFLLLRCPKCGNEQIIYSHAVNRIRCNVCDIELAEPTGGKAKLKGEVVVVFE